MSVDSSMVDRVDGSENVAATVTIDINTSDSEPSSPVSIEFYDGSDESVSESNSVEVFDRYADVDSDTGSGDTVSLHSVGSSESDDVTSDDDDSYDSADSDDDSGDDGIIVLGDRSSEGDDDDGESDDDGGDDDDGLAAVAGNGRRDDGKRSREITTTNGDVLANRG